MTARGFRIPPPPAHAVSFRSDRLDEVQAFACSADGPHARVVHGRGPLHYERHDVEGDRVQMSWGGAALPQSVCSTVPVHALVLSQGGRARITIGQRELTLAQGEAAVVPAGWEYTRLTTPGRFFTAGVDPGALNAELAARFPHPGDRWALQVRTFRMDAVEQAGIESALVAAVPAGAGGDARGRERAEHQIIAAFADVAVRESAATRAVSALDPRRAADLEGWIDAHLDAPITLGILCRIAGVCARTLQRTFLERRGVSPMHFVTERRLAHAHAALLHPAAGDDVTRIAFAAGFTHLGRFAGAYRNAYGESPSASLTRGTHGDDAACRLSDSEGSGTGV